MSKTLEEAQSVLWEDLVEAMKPKLDAMQQDLLNKGQCFAKITNKGIQFIPCEAVYIKEDKPTKKVIDLSVLIDGIDCEFWDANEAGIFISKVIKQSKRISLGTREYRYYDVDGDTWDRCQPRMNHIHAWQGGECPLPEGFEVKVWLRGDTFPKICVRLDWVLQKHSSKDIIAFEVLGVADGYVMPWEQDDE